MFTADSYNLHVPNTPPESSHGSPSLDNRKILHNDVSNTEVVLESPPPGNESPPPSSESLPLGSESPSPTAGSPVPAEDIFIAKFDLIPESDTELALTAGEQVVIIERADNGWWHGVIDERHGWIPETFLQPLQVVGASEGMESADTDGNSEESNGTSVRPRGMTEFHSGTSEEVNVSGKLHLKQKQPIFHVNLSHYTSMHSLPIIEMWY